MALYARICLNQLTLPVTLGWLAEERAHKQTVEINIELKFLTRPLGCETDELTDTLCYAELIQHIQDHIQEKSFQLLEYFTATVYNIIKSYLSDNVLIAVQATKKPPIHGLNGGVTFCYGDTL